MATGHIFIILIPIFFVILIGYFAGLFKAFNPASSKGLNTLVTKFALPAHLFIGITTTPRIAYIRDKIFYKPRRDADIYMILGCSSVLNILFF
ncbi:hypothetical protein QD47_26905 [Paenibacillus terrae]|uniref:Uncharacterized protein n=1 Tax=Paenibacillus terrae TaxID=159743 RepID=A0A0D7WY43_9BACL|nr:hypothetical protein QD47_26905 [Paenibacillus terrae]